MAPVTTPAVLLRAHAYGDTSRILRFYTRDHGLLGVMGRGVRGKGGKGATVLSSFATGELTAYVRGARDLHTMKDFACTRLRSGLGGHVLRFAGASAVAELVVAHADQEPRPEIFDALEESLDALDGVAEARIPATCLSGAWRIVAAFGFTPELDACTRCGMPIDDEDMARFDLGAGGVIGLECAEDTDGPRVGPVARSQLRALLGGDLDVPLSHPRRHLALMSDFVAFHVAQRPLKSLRFLGDMLPPDPPA